MSELKALMIGPSRFYINGKNRRAKAPFPVVVASYEQIERIVGEKSALCFVWPDEVLEGKQGSIYAFNERHKNTQPLIIDLFSASAIQAAYTGSSDKTKGIIKENGFKSRNQFKRLYDIVMKATG